MNPSGPNFTAKSYCKQSQWKEYKITISDTVKSWNNTVNIQGFIQGLPIFSSAFSQRDNQRNTQDKKQQLRLMAPKARLVLPHPMISPY